MISVDIKSAIRVIKTHAIMAYDYTYNRGVSAIVEDNVAQRVRSRVDFQVKSRIIRRVYQQIDGINEIG